MAGRGQVPELIRRELKPDETVLWSGQPRPVAVLRGKGSRIGLDVLMLLGVIAGLFFGRGVVAPVVLVVPAAAALALCALLFKDIREATSGHLIHFAITETRLIIVSPRSRRPAFSIMRGLVPGGDMHRLAWLQFGATIRKHDSRRATIKVPYKRFSYAMPREAPRIRTEWESLTSVEDAVAAFELLRRPSVLS